MEPIEGEHLRVLAYRQEQVMRGGCAPHQTVLNDCDNRRQPRSASKCQNGPTASRKAARAEGALDGYEVAHLQLVVDVAASRASRMAGDKKLEKPPLVGRRRKAVHAIGADSRQDQFGVAARFVRELLTPLDCEDEPTHPGCER